MRGLFIAVLGVGLLGGCGGANGTGTPVGERQTVIVPSGAPFAASSKVDLLFVLDKGTSGAAVMPQFQRDAPSFLQALTQVTVAGAPLDLHVGVISNDFGSGSTGAPGCTPGGLSGGGDGGRLIGIGSKAPANCARPRGSNFIEYVEGGANNLPENQGLTETFTCMSSIGFSGCGFRHPLAAAYGALHNNLPENVGFLREDAALAVVFVTPRDDCSGAPDTNVFDKFKVEFGYEDIYRCHRFGTQCEGTPLPYQASGRPLTDCIPLPNPEGSRDKLLDVQQFIDFFSHGGVKADPSRVLLAAIAGPDAPVEVILTNPGTPLGQPYIPCGALNESSNPPCVPMVQFACTSANNPGLFGDPAVRLLTVVRSAAAHIEGRSCDDSYAATLAQVAAALGGNGAVGGDMSGACLPFALPKSGGMLQIDCQVKDTSKDGASVAIPRCSSPPSAYPCYVVAASPQCASSPDMMRIRVERNGMTPPAGTITTAACVSAPKVKPDGGTSGGGTLDWVSYCNKNCDKSAECSGGAITATQCKQQAMCSAYKGPATGGGGCSNLQAIFDCYSGCLSMSCQQLGTCVTGCPTCKQ